VHALKALAWGGHALHTLLGSHRTTWRAAGTRTGTRSLQQLYEADRHQETGLLLAEVSSGSFHHVPQADSAPSNYTYFCLSFKFKNKIFPDTELRTTLSLKKKKRNLIYKA